MGYLEDLRAQRAREEAAGIIKPRLTDNDVRRLGVQRLDETGVSEVASLLGRGVNIDDYGGNTGNRDPHFRASITTRFEEHNGGGVGASGYTKDIVQIEPSLDGGMTISGQYAYHLSADQIRANPSLVTDALGRAIAEPLTVHNYSSPVPDQEPRRHGDHDPSNNGNMG